ncbi:MAG TPA: Holliday junction branch migration protein RuvA, partial [Gemmatimonadota bacterium]|nr:Holliday junction branch migration protein RuvA [Gemmatimonadota bacterium]
MISRVRGVLVAKELDRVEIATAGGVSYELQIPSSAYEALPRQGQEVELHAALIGRDDGLELYGFRDVLERQLFIRLQSASGVGPRLALTMLSAMHASQLVDAIRGRDLARLCTVSGVGKKKAERIALELGDKLEDMVVAAARVEPESAMVESAVSALVALGFSRTEAEGAVRVAVRGRDEGARDVESL